MRIRLTRHLGQNKPGTILDLTAPEVDTLVRGGHGVRMPDSEPDPVTDEPDSDDDTTGRNVDDLKLEDLKARAGKLRLPTYGTKAQLADRIKQAEQTQAGRDAADTVDGYDDRTYLLVEPGETGPRFTPIPSCDPGTHNCYADSFTFRDDDPRLWPLREFVEVRRSERGAAPGRLAEATVVALHLPVPDPELTADWQRFVDSVAHTPSPSLCGDTAGSNG